MTAIISPTRKTLKAVEGNGQVVFRYAAGTNPNGSMNDIAAVTNERGNVLGMMPHPENLIEAAHGGTDGAACSLRRWMYRGLRRTTTGLTGPAI